MTIVRVDQTRVLRGVQKYEAARAEVAPYVGEVPYAFDSADAVYAHALKQLGHDVAGLAGQPDAARAIFSALKDKRAKPRIVVDAQTTADRTARFPHGGRLLNPFN